MKRILIILLAISGICLGQGSYIGPFIDPMWRDIISEPNAHFQPDTDSTTFFQVKQADGTVFLNGDSTNGRVGIGTDVLSFKFQISETEADLIIQKNISSNTNTITDKILVSDGSTNSANNHIIYKQSIWGRFVADKELTRISHIKDYASGAQLSGEIKFYCSNLGTIEERLRLSGYYGNLFSKDSGSSRVLAIQNKGLTNADWPVLDFHGGPYSDGGAGTHGTPSNIMEIKSCLYNNSAQHIGSLIAYSSGSAFGHFDCEWQFWNKDKGEENITKKFVIMPNGFVGFYEPNPETLLELTHATPYQTFHNSTHEDTDGGRESRINFKGEQSGGEETTLARIEASHDGAADNQKGKIGIYTNDGSDDDAPTLRMTIDSVGAIDVIGDFTAGTIQADDGVSGTLELDDGSTEKITLVFTGGILTLRTVAATTGSVLADWTD